MVRFRRPAEDDPRDKEPKVDDPDYAAKLARYNAFLKEGGVYCEIQYVRDDFSLFISVISDAYGPNFFSCIQKNAGNVEAALQWSLPYILACQASDKRRPRTSVLPLHGKLSPFSFTYEGLKTKRARELEELYSRPYEDIAVEEFVEKLPGPQVEKIHEPMDTSGSVSDTSADIPQGEMADSSKKDATNVPRETDAPESSPPGEASGAKVEKTEGSPQGEVSGDQDVHMGGAEEVKDDDRHLGETEKRHRSGGVL
ncbi:unnamed protein product [Symbiodinium necroappetens]|uniref:Uncharacterized protein n=1 Tax=Symbiodinium necroappetens TaxID=1628268 RepID=A0A812VDN6_9DINO|nr:unnamed protein product [Symbiodinium necroappetens]